MNLIEAKKSGKPFRREGENEWFIDIESNHTKEEHGIIGVPYFILWTKDYRLKYLREADLFADDYELKED